MALGDNIFYGNGFVKLLDSACDNAKNGKATIFGYEVHDPEVIGYNNGWLNDSDLSARAELLRKNSYGKYLQKVLKKKM